MGNTQTKNILFIGTHLDDIEIGAGAYLHELKKNNNNNIKIICCSTGAMQHRISSPEIYSQRKEVTNKNFNGIETLIYQADIDLDFESSKFDLNRFIRDAAEILFPGIADSGIADSGIADSGIADSRIADSRIDTIIGPSSDIHKDHRIIKEIVDILARPDQGVKRYLMYVIPGSDAFNNLYGAGPQLSKYFFSFDDYRPKKELLKGYVKAGVLPRNKTIRSVKGIRKACRYWGAQVNSKYAELFNIGFIHDGTV